MKKIFPPWTFAALLLLLAAPAYRPANAQESNHSRQLPVQHLAPDTMSATDAAALQAHEGELAEAARIYGYKFEAGNWSYEQTLCAPMPETILLHYFQKFSDGTESLFTALVPRGAGRVRIVPVLYRNVTPYLPAPKNPRNYSVFNELVPRNAANRDWLELSACYAEMTGGLTSLPPGASEDIGIAGAPSATVHLDVQEKSTSVTFAEREGARTYRIWSIAFNRDGRVTAAGTEERSVVAAKSVPPASPAETSAPSQLEETKTQPVPGVSSSQPATEASKQPAQKSAQTPTASVATESKIQPANGVQPATRSAIPSPPPAAPPANQAPATAQSMPRPATSAVAAEPPSEPGWKLVLHPAEPPSKIVSQAPPPPEKITPEPPDPTQQTAPADQSH
jgi:hypothetical protein